MMSIYSNENLIRKVNEASIEELREIFKRLVNTKMAKTTKHHLARIITNLDIEDTDTSMVKIGAVRYVSVRKLKALQRSGMLDYAFYFVSAALAPHGPFDIKDVIMAAATSSGAYELIQGRLTLTKKSHVGLILSAAGMRQKSNYHKELGKNRNVWVMLDEFKGLDSAFLTNMALDSISSEMRRYNLVKTPKIEELI